MKTKKKFAAALMIVAAGIVMTASAESAEVEAGFHHGPGRMGPPPREWHGPRPPHHGPHHWHEWHGPHHWHEPPHHGGPVPPPPPPPPHHHHHHHHHYHHQPIGVEPR